MKIKNKAIKLLAGMIMSGFLTGTVISVPVLAETTVATDVSASDSILLNDLQCSPVDIEFSPNINSYRIVVPEGTEKILVSAQLADPTSIYRVIGNNNLQSGSNAVKVEVEDMDGNKNVYEIQVIVGELNEEEITETDSNTETETVLESESSSKEHSMAVVSSQDINSPSNPDDKNSSSSIIDTVKEFIADQKNFKWILCGIGVIAILLIILCVILSLRKSKRKKSKNNVGKSAKNTVTNSKPVITHDLSWTKKKAYTEEKEDKILSDLMQSLQEDDTTTTKPESVKEVLQSSVSNTDNKIQNEPVNVSEQNLGSSKEDDEDDAFEIVDIDKL